MASTTKDFLFWKDHPPWPPLLQNISEIVEMVSQLVGVGYDMASTTKDFLFGKEYPP